MLRNVSLPGSITYKVKNGDSWVTIARDNGIDPGVLIDANFRTRVPAEVNWYLHHYVGCVQTTHDGQNYVFSDRDSPGLIRIPQTGPIHFAVPMVAQRQNPICWIASSAMILSYKNRSSQGLEPLTGGFDPSSSSIPNPTTSWADQYLRLTALGFVSEDPFPDRSPDAAYIENLLRAHGPWMLTHLATDILPGIFSPTSTHAVVITGIDIGTGRVWFNNPWGVRDQITTVNAILAAMEHLFSRGIRAVAYIP